MPQAIQMKRRIRSIRSTKKIMKAMELIAAAKWRKAAQDLNGIREYTDTLHVAEQATRPQTTPQITAETFIPASRELLVILASDRGLCGGYHARLGRFLAKTLEDGTLRAPITITVGRRAEPIARRLGLSIQASLPSYLPGTKSSGCHDLLSLIQRERTAAPTDLYFVYTNYRNALTQDPALLHIPASSPALTLEQEHDPAVFEPNYATFRSHLEERSLLAQILTSVYHASNSEQAARVQAMGQASRSASDMLDGLTLALNQSRQATITQELSELSAGIVAIH